MISKKGIYIILCAILICASAFGVYRALKDDDAKSRGISLYTGEQSASQGKTIPSSQTLAETSTPPSDIPDRAKTVAPATEPDAHEASLQGETGMAPDINATEYSEIEDHQIAFKETYNDYSKDTSGIDKDLVVSGKMFSGDIYSLKQLPLNTPVTIEIDGSTWQGTVTKNRPSQTLAGNSFVKVSLGRQGEYMTAYFDDKSTKGKLYTSEGSYMYEHNGDAGFIISIYEYKKINNALHID